MDEAVNTFIAEAHELLAVLEGSLLRIGEGEVGGEQLNEIFRCAHTIKGSAGLFGFDHIVEFTHDVENVLDRARDREIQIDGDLLALLLRSCDYIQALVACVENEKTVTPGLEAQGVEIREALSPWTSQGPAASSGDAKSSAVVCSGIWHISLRMGIDALRNGMDPIAIIRYLSSMGELSYVELIDNDIQIDSFDAESLYLGFELGLKTDKPKSDIDDAFVFIRDDADIKIVPPRSSIDQYIRLIKESATGEERLGEILVRSGAITQSELSKALDKQRSMSTAKGRPPIGEVLVAEKATNSDVISAAIDSQVGRRSSKPRFIRVDSERLDRLINLIGETVIGHQKIELISGQIKNTQLDEAVVEIQSLTEQVRDAALVLRMVAIGETFQKFRRVVRDVAESLGKSIRLELYGEDTELDRSMVEKISDPLTHIVRNAIDHGIESAEKRAERNKPEFGTIKLNAYHDSGNVVITIEDDGGGLNSRRIKEKALEAKLIREDEELSESEIHSLIFHPGFSTADSVTNLSGRGVGMDVVRRNIEELQGSISIESVEGIGTKLSIRLPLTLAIIDGFHISASGTEFIVPHNAIVECLDFDSTTKLERNRSINLRGELVPYIPLKDIFALSGPESEQKKLLIVRFGKRQAGILVDQLLGELQTVVKPLNPLFSALKGIGGSSLLGSGAIAFILDIPQLIEFAIRSEARLTLKESAHHE